MAVEFSCFHCNQKLSFSDSNIGLREECPQCRSDVHVCKNCEFYDPKAYNECRESSADVVREKDRSNFCDYFRPSDRTKATNDKEKILSAAEALFKKK